MTHEKKIIEEALNFAATSCRYHGTNWGFLGWEPWGPPRCDSCKEPYAAMLGRGALETLTDELDHWRSGRRVKGLPQVQAVPDGLQYAAALVRAQGTEGGEDHDRLLAEAAVRLRDLSDAARHLLAEAVVLRGERDQALGAVESLVVAAVTPPSEGTQE